MKKSELHKDQGLRLALQRKNEAAERMTLSDDFTDRLMQRIGQQDKQPKRRRAWLYPAIGIAASILLLFSVGIIFNNRQSDQPDLVAKTDTIKTSPQTEIKTVKEQPLETVDSVKKIKEKYRMPRPPKHFMAKAEVEEEAPTAPELTDENELAEIAVAEEVRRMEMQRMAQMGGSLQAEFKAITDEIRSRGERMTQHVEIAMSNEE